MRDERPTMLTDGVYRLGTEWVGWYLYDATALRS